jgi:D-alanine-D-alanine ligase
MSDIYGKKIAVLKGGPGSERPVSLASAAGVARALRGLGAEVTEIDVTGREVPQLNGAWLAFNVIHGTFGEDGELQRQLDARGIPYTGEGVNGSELAFDKIRTKEKLVEANVPTPEYEVIRVGEQPTLPLPYVVKAPKQGSSVGVVIVKTEEEIQAALDEVSKYDDVLLIERFEKGRELTVGILGDIALPIIEISPREGFYDFKNKYPFLNPQAGGAADHRCPAPLSPEMTAQIQDIALRAHRALGLEVYSRVDFVLGEHGPVVLEINTIPGMTESSLLPEAAAAAGIPYDELCECIIHLSLDRMKQ